MGSFPTSLHPPQLEGRASSQGVLCRPGVFPQPGRLRRSGRSTRLGDTGRTPGSLGCVMVSPASRRCCDDGRGNDYTPLGVLSGGSKNVNVGGKRIGSHS